MLDMGFIRDIRKILALLPSRRQNLLFSATFSDEIRRACRRLPGPARHGGGRPPQHAGGARPPGGPPGRPRAQARAPEPADPDGRDPPGAGLHQDEARREPAVRAAGPRRDRRGRDPRQQEPAAARSRPQTTSRPAAWTSSSRPTSRRGGSTSRRSRTSSTTSSDGPEDYVHRIGPHRPGRDRRDRALARLPSTRRSSCATSRALLGGESRRRRSPASRRTSRSARSRSACAPASPATVNGLRTARPADARYGSPGAEPVRRRTPCRGSASARRGAFPDVHRATRAARPATGGHPGAARPAARRGDPRSTPRHAGAARAEAPAERPPWARDAGRVNGERVHCPAPSPGSASPGSPPASNGARRQRDKGIA